MGTSFDNLLVNLRVSRIVDDLDPYLLDGGLLRVPAGGSITGKISKPASKPADPAFKRALRQAHMQIGLRYIGD